MIGCLLVWMESTVCAHRAIPSKLDVDNFLRVQNRVGVHTTQAHDGLQQAILRGKLLPNTALSEATISSLIEVSRTPVREDWLLTDFFCQSVCTDPLVTVPGVP